jgi:hypothetical protein
MLRILGSRQAAADRPECDPRPYGERDMKHTESSGAFPMPSHKKVIQKSLYMGFLVIFFLYFRTNIEVHTQEGYF